MANHNALDLESPNLFYDDSSAQFIVTWSCTLARNAIQAPLRVRGTREEGSSLLDAAASHAGPRVRPGR